MVSFRGGAGGTFAPLAKAAPLLRNYVSHFFQRVIGCNEYRTETQHMEYLA